MEGTYTTNKEKVDLMEACKMVVSGVKQLFVWLYELRLIVQVTNQLHTHDKIAITIEELWASVQCHMRMKKIDAGEF